MAHSARWPSLIRLRVPCPRCRTSRIQTSGSSVWVRASRTTPPSPTGTKRPCAPVKETNVKLFPPSKFNNALMLQLCDRYLGRLQCIGFPSSSSYCVYSVHSGKKKNRKTGQCCCYPLLSYLFMRPYGTNVWPVDAAFVKGFFYKNNMQKNKAAKMVSQKS